MVPSGSFEPLPLNGTTTSSVVVLSEPAFATGGRFAIVMIAVSVSVAPLLSVTVRVAV